MKDRYYYASMGGTLIVCSGIIGLAAALVYMTGGLVLLAVPAGLLALKGYATLMRRCGKERSDDGGRKG